MRKHFFLYLVVLLLVALPRLAMTQTIIEVRDNFISELVRPTVFFDSTRNMTIEQVAGLLPTRFEQLSGAHIQLSAAEGNWWFHFKVNNQTTSPQRVVLRINRRNFDEFDLWQKDTSRTTRYLGKIASDSTQERFLLVNGYYYDLVLQPGENSFNGKITNRIGPTYVGLSLHSTVNYAVYSRQSNLLFGIFLGVLMVSMLAAVALYYFSREWIYLIYVAGLIAMAMREIYNFSCDFNLAPDLLRHSTPFLIAATSSALFRRIMRLDQWRPALNNTYLVYSWVAFASGILVYILVKLHFDHTIELFFLVANILNLVFIISSSIIALLRIKDINEARFLFFGSLPLAAAFIAIGLRDLDVIPSYRLLQFVVALGFIFQILAFTAAFSQSFRRMERSRSELVLELENEQKSKLLAVQAAEQREKDRIARDLHDDVAASLSSIRILSGVAKSEFSTKLPEAAPILEQIHKTAVSTLDGIGDLIWAIKPHPDYLNDIADRMREQAVKILEARGISYMIDIPRELPKMEFDIEARRNVYMIFKEALNNALKHSECTYLEIDMFAENNTLTLIVEDNGKGFQPESILRSNGLNNMKSRARDIGGTLEIASEPGIGSKITFLIDFNQGKLHTVA